jgi:hypothetical protein
MSVRQSREKWPFSKLQPGQSFVIPAVSLNSAIAICGKHRDYGKFATPVVEEKGERVTRVWRVE